MGKIEIILVDDHPMMLAGLNAVLKHYDQIVVVDSYTNAEELRQGLKSHVPDVLLLDLMLPDVKGTELVTEIRNAYPELPILILTSIDTPAMVSSMMRRGCKGYLLKGAGPNTLVEAIETVHGQGEYIQEELKEHLLQNIIKYKSEREASFPLPKLSEREKQILKLIAEENTTEEIAKQLFLSYRTVENHRYNIMQKLDVKNMAGLVKVAIQLGLV